MANVGGVVGSSGHTSSPRGSSRTATPREAAFRSPAVESPGPIARLPFGVVTPNSRNKLPVESASAQVCNRVECLKTEARVQTKRSPGGQGVQFSSPAEDGSGGEWVSSPQLAAIQTPAPTQRGAPEYTPPAPGTAKFLRRTVDKAIGLVVDHVDIMEKPIQALERALSGWNKISQLKVPGAVDIAVSLKPEGSKADLNLLEFAEKQRLAELVAKQTKAYGRVTRATKAFSEALGPNADQQKCVKQQALKALYKQMNTSDPQKYPEPKRLNVASQSIRKATDVLNGVKTAAPNKRDARVQLLKNTVTALTTALPTSEDTDEFTNTLRRATQLGLDEAYKTFAENDAVAITGESRRRSLGIVEKHRRRSTLPVPQAAFNEVIAEHEVAVAKFREAYTIDGFDNTLLTGPLEELNEWGVDITAGFYNQKAGEDDSPKVGRDTPYSDGSDESDESVTDIDSGNGAAKAAATVPLGAKFHQLHLETQKAKEAAVTKMQALFRVNQARAEVRKQTQARPVEKADSVAAVTETREKNFQHLTALWTELEDKFDEQPTLWKYNTNLDAAFNDILATKETPPADTEAYVTMLGNCIKTLTLEEPYKGIAEMALARLTTRNTGTPQLCAWAMSANIRIALSLIEAEGSTEVLYPQEGGGAKLADPTGVVAQVSTPQQQTWTLQDIEALAKSFETAATAKATATSDTPDSVILGYLDALKSLLSYVSEVTSKEFEMCRPLLEILEENRIKREALSIRDKKGYVTICALAAGDARVCAQMVESFSHG